MPSVHFPSPSQFFSTPVPRDRRDQLQHPFARQGLAYQLSLLTLLASIAEGAFPNYDDPRTGEPPLPTLGQPCFEAYPIVEAGLRDWGNIASGTVSIPADAACSDWTQIILELHGSVAGLQFDRFGFLWFRGVELLRLTTPEPSPKGITWSVTKDVSEYMDLFREAGEISVSIPTIVNEKYTGVLYLNVSLTFFSDPNQTFVERTTKGRRAASTPLIYPLRNISKLGWPPISLDVSHPEEQVNFVVVPPNVSELYMDLYASGHGCEEFWYSNGQNASVSHCEGGSYRELNVYVDGYFAGAQHPYPVLYTGGINPLLWRPITAPLSFNIPPYRFDLTPFLSWLVDGKEHNITISVFGQWQGNWFLNGVLLMHQDPRGISPGTVRTRPLLRELTESLESDTPGSWIQKSDCTTRYYVVGTVFDAEGKAISTKVRGHLRARSTLKVESGEGMEVDGLFASTTSTIRDGHFARSTSRVYPLQVLDSYKQDNETLQWESCLKSIRNITDVFSSEETSAFSVALNDGVDSCVTYNRSRTNRSLIHMLDTMSTEDFTVAISNRAVDVDLALQDPPALLEPSSQEKSCLQNKVSAKDGSFVFSEYRNSCQLPVGLYVCGSVLCQTSYALAPDYGHVDGDNDDQSTAFNWESQILAATKPGHPQEDSAAVAQGLNIDIFGEDGCPPPFRTASALMQAQLLQDLCCEAEKQGHGQHFLV